jgi:hypothetical protein
MDILKYHSILDSERFGYNIAKINSFEEPIKEVLKALQMEDYKLILSKVSADNVNFINELEQNGFLMKDIQLTYKYDLLAPIFFSPSNEVIIRNAELGDKEELYEIAMKSFRDYGHYSADKKLDSIKCQEIYGDWIIRSYDKKVADNILLAEINGQIAGFLTHKIYTKDFKYAAGGIGAVDPKFRNKEIFKAITIAGLNWAIANNCKWVEHNVLVTNYPVNRSFIKLGFKTSNSFLTFHKWL